MAAEGLTIAAAALLGLSFGAGPCNVTCLPLLGPLFLAGERAWRVVLPFSLGRLSGYAGLGLGAGLLGEGLGPWLESGAPRWLTAAAAVVVGVMLWRRAGRGGCPVASPAAERPLRPVARPPLPGGLFLMGAGMALNPCAPLGIVLAAAAATGDGGAGLALGFGFGAGAVLVPALLFGLGVARLGQELRHQLAQWHRPLERGAAGMLILLGGLIGSGAVAI